jgi:hypothetical protein
MTSLPTSREEDSVDISSTYKLIVLSFKCGDLDFSLKDT